jgi:hypothetical protein
VEVGTVVVEVEVVVVVVLVVVDGNGGQMVFTTVDTESVRFGKVGA